MPSFKFATLDLISESPVTCAHGNGIFVVILRDSSRVFTSPDALVWTESVMPGTGPWNSITFGAGKFVAVAYSGPSGGTEAATSTDGIAWTMRTLPTTDPWWSVGFGNGLFVALSRGVAAASSLDGIVWTARTIPLSTSPKWVAPVFGNGLFLTTNEDTNETLRSTDAVTWTMGALPIELLYANHVTFGAGAFVVLGDSNRIARTLDGVTWTSYDLTALIFLSSVSAIFFGGSMFFAVSRVSTFYGLSLDGITWAQETGLAYTEQNSLFFGESRFVSIANPPPFAG